MRHAILVIFCLLQVFAHSALSLEYWVDSAAQGQHADAETAHD